MLERLKAAARMKGLCLRKRKWLLLKRIGFVRCLSFCVAKGDNGRFECVAVSRVSKIPILPMSTTTAPHISHTLFT